MIRYAPTKGDEPRHPPTEAEPPTHPGANPDERSNANHNACDAQIRIHDKSPAYSYSLNVRAALFPRLRSQP